MKLEGENGVRGLFAEHGLSFTILRPGILLDGPPLQHTLQFYAGDTIDRSEVAEAAVVSLTHPKAHNNTFELIRSVEQNTPVQSLEPFFDTL